MKRSLIQRRHCQSWLMVFTGHTLKYFLLTWAGFTIAYIVGSVLEVSFLTAAIAAVINTILVRSLILLACLGAITAIRESIRPGS